MKIVKLLSIILGSALLGSCSFTPESIQLNPQLQTSQSNIGAGKTVAVRIIDDRADTSLGGRASQYGPAAKISLASDLSSTVEKGIEFGLQKQGFKTTSYSDSAQRRLIVRITALQYQTNSGFWAGHVTVSGTLDAVGYNGSRRYEQVYRGQDIHSVEITPSSTSDSQHVNSAVSSMINNLINDKALMRFLAK